jgi:hypothetical protein
MLKQLTLLLGLAASCLAAPAAVEARQTTKPLATWLWTTEILNQPAQVKSFFDYTVANGVKRVFAQVNADVPIDTWKSFVSTARDNGIFVEALIGRGEWVIGQGTPSLEDSLTWIKKYAAASSGNNRLTGIQMDVEPWAKYEDWDTDKNAQARYIKGWENVAQQVRKVANDLEMRAGVALPFWANTINSSSGEPVDEWMMNLMDYSAFMTYRNTVDEFMKIAQPALAVGDKTGKDFWLSMETTDISPAYLTYHGKTATELRSDLNAIVSRSQSYRTFQGVCVHDYDGWRVMAKKSR